MKTLLRTLSLSIALGGLSQVSLQAARSPFAISATMSVSNSLERVVFNFQVPAEHVLYADRLVFETEDGKQLIPASIPEPVTHRDSVTGRERAGYEHPFAAELNLEAKLPFNLIVRLQGCSNSACYFPERHTFLVNSPGTISPVDVPPPALATAEGENARSEASIATNGFKVVARETGFVPKAAFVKFLKASKSGENTAEAGSRFEALGPLATLVLIVVGGLGLNFTPCVLPMIPINLAIIGAGARAGSRRRGFALGGIYGLGMALAYGALGLVVVLSGAKFGTLNSSPWFNLGIALVFVVMALAMFDLLHVDFSRFQGRAGTPGTSSKGPFAVALGMGVMAALLAGACVAPVVISVLLLASHLYVKGMIAGLFLPFLLGVGMALPWPFAGAGLSFLPKPGKWMSWVKYSFGGLIILFAAYYATLAWNLSKPANSQIAFAKPGDSSEAAPDNQDKLLADALERGRTEKRPVLIDFAASWCKNCTAMDASVFPSAEVKDELKDFVVVRYEAEKPNDSPAREVLNQFGVMGLPTYVVLKPED